MINLTPKMWWYVGIFILFLALSLYGFWQATHPPKLITKLTPKDFGWEFEEVSLTTKDKVKLAAWLVPSETKSDKVIILLHGYPADKANLLQWAEFLHKDFNLFFLDFRYFGDSEGSQTTIGAGEQKDLQAAVKYLSEKEFEKVGAMGFSLGGAVAILTAAHDDRIKAIVSDSAFANLDLMGYEFYQNLFVFKYPLTFLTKLWARMLLGFNPDEAAPEKAAANLKIPILLIHSQKDATIPFENALRLQKALKANSKAQFFYPAEDSHGFLPDDILADYQQRVLEFFKKELK